MSPRIRVYELARECGVDSRTVLQLLNEPAATSASSSLTEAQADLVRRRLRPGDAEPAPGEPQPGPTVDRSAALTLVPVPSATGLAAEPSKFADPTEASRDKLRALVRAAFERARESGKDDWRHMSTAVLKNRISQVGGEKFDQRSYGYRRMLDLAEDFSDMLAIDETTHPPLLFLLPEPPAMPSSSSIIDPRIDEGAVVRPDLWAAVVDYASEERYFLVNGVAKRESEFGDEPDVGQPLPTISPETMDGWRVDFAGSQVVTEHTHDPALAARLRAWIDERRGTRALPGILQGVWNLYLKRAVVSRLLAWYESTGLRTPNDLTLERRLPSAPPPVTDESKLRDALISALRGMTLDEMRRIQLPASALLNREP